MRTDLIKIIILLLLLSVNTFSQITLTVYTRNADDGKPVNSADVRIDGRVYGTASGGETVINYLKPGYYDISASRINFGTDSARVYLTADTAVTLTLIPKSITLDEVTITSGRYETNRDNLTFSASIAGMQAIEKIPSAPPAELLRYEPGISLIRDGIWGSDVNIRGLSRSNIVTLIDGSRIETANDLSARLSLIDPSDIERIEVIKGASSVLYGSGATGGVVNIVSKEAYYSPVPSLSGKAGAGYGSMNGGFMKSLNLFYGDNNKAAKLTVSHRDADNTRTPAGELPNSQFEDMNVSASVKVKTAAAQEVFAGYQQFKAIDVGIPGGAPAFPANASVRYPEEFRRLLTAGYIFKNISSSFNRLTLKYFNQYILRDVENKPGQVQTVRDSAGTPVRRVNVLSINPSADHYSFGASAQADFTFGRNHLLIAGIDFWKRRYEGIRSRNLLVEVLNPAGNIVRTVSNIIYEKPLPNSDMSSAGLFVNSETKLMDERLLVIGGVRYDNIFINNGEAVNPVYEVTNGVINYSPASQVKQFSAGSVRNSSYAVSAGLLYRLSPEAALLINGSKSFRSPALEERYQYIDLGNILRLGNPDLGPEEGWFSEAGLRVKNGFINLEGTVFLNSLNGLVVEAPGIYEGRQAFIKTNAGTALLTGGELNLQVKLPGNFMVYSNASYVRGRDTKEDKNLPQMPPLNGIAGLQYSFEGIGALDLRAVLFAKQNHTAPGETAAGGYTYYNIYFTTPAFDAGAVKLNVSLGAENLFDKAYMDHIATTRGNLRLEPGRNIFIKTYIAF